MLQFRIVTDEEECRNLWEKFSPKKIIWDLWDFRFCFHTGDFNFNFILGFDGREVVGLLPLVFDKKEKYYTYFGEDFPEQNKFLLNDKRNIKLFLENCPKCTEIYYIDWGEAKHYDFKPDGKRYYLNMEKYGNSFENYLKSFNKKHRKNLTYDLKKLNERGYSTEHNKTKDFETLAELNKKRFGNDSNYNDENFVLSISKLIDAALKIDALDILSIKIGNNVEAVGLGVFYNKVYYVLGSGRNVEIKNLGKLMTAEQIKSAITHKCSKFDFLSTESAWKELWNFDSEQMYKFTK